LAWSGSWLYGVPKAVHLAVLGIWGVTGCAVIIGPDNDRMKRFCSTIVLLSLFMGFEVVSHIVEGTLLEEWDFASNYLGLGRLLGLSVLILVSVLLWAGRGLSRSLPVVVLIIFLVSILLIAGGRGPLLATLVPLFIPAMVDVRMAGKGFLVRKNLLLMVVILALVLVGFVTIGNQYFGFTTIDRLWILLEGGGGGSAQFRVWFFSRALESWWTSPLAGHGIGDFGSLIHWGDVRVYPHNLFLEVLVELGVIGLVLLLAGVFQAMKRISIMRMRRDVVLAMVLMLVLNAFLNAQVSGDLPDNRVMFALFGLFAGRSNCPRQSVDGRSGRDQ
jgi:O-antigen ligase